MCLDPGRSELTNTVNLILLIYTISIYRLPGRGPHKVLFFWGGGDAQIKDAQSKTCELQKSNFHLHIEGGNPQPP